MVRTIFTFVCIILTNTVWSQEIYSFGSPQVLLTAAEYKDTELRYFSVGTCKGGLLELESERGHLSTECYFTFKSKFRTTEDRWVLLTNSYYADDILQEITSIYYGDQDSIIGDGIVIDYPRTLFVDYTILNDYIVMIPEHIENTLLQVDFQGTVIDSFPTHFQPTHIENLDGQLIISSSDQISILSNDWNAISTMTIENPKELKVKESQLFYLSNDHIGIFQSGMTDFEKININLPHQVIDFEIDDSVIYLLTDNNQLYSWDETIWLLEYSYTQNEYIQLTKILNEEVLFGNYILPEDLYTGVNNAIKIDRTTDYEISDLLDIRFNEANEVLTSADTVRVTEDTIILDKRFKYEIDFTFINRGQDTIDQVLVLSNRLHGFNCAWAQHLKRYNDLNLAPGESIDLFGTMFTSHLRFNEICLYAISIDGQIDHNFENISSCTSPISNTEDLATTKTKTFFHPTLTNDYLYLSDSRLKETVKIIDSNGNYYPIDLSSNQINVSHLNAGMYYIIYLYQGTQRVEKFVKV